MTAVRLFTENQSISDPRQQSARTCAAAGEHSSHNIRKVNWNEMFFFKVESEVCELRTSCPHIHDSCSNYG
jgi:vacuolar protein sorting-associated protein 13A/C